MSGRRHATSLAMLAASCLASASAFAASDPQAIVDRYVAATGGAQALVQQAGLHLKGRIHSMHMDGTMEVWHAPPDRLAKEMRLGTLRYRTGYDGRQGWRTDLTSKQVQPLAGKELDQIRADAYFENEMWAREGRGGGRLALGPSSFRDGREFTALDVTPPVGGARRLWFDSKTGRCVRERLQSDNQADAWLSEYETLGGRLRPTIQDTVDPSLQAALEPGQLERAWIDSVVAYDDTLVYLSPTSHENPVTWSDTTGVAHVPFRFGSRQVWVKVSINGAPPADFLLDTGASLSVIDVSYAASLQLVPQGEFAVQGASGHDHASFATVKRMRVGEVRKDGVELSDFRAAILPLAMMSEFTGRRMNGLLGSDFLSRFVVDLDYGRGTVTFHAPSYSYRGPGAPLEMKLMDGLPVVSAAIDGRCRGDFLVDVGNSFGLILHGAHVRSCGTARATADRPQIKMYSGGVGGAVATWLTRIDSLNVGPFSIPAPIVGLTLSTQGMVGNDDLVGNIGSGLLRRFRCVFDYPHHTLFLEAGPSLGEPDRYSRAGATFLHFADHVIVAEVLDGSPAEEAGLEPGIEITEIDGKPAGSYTLEAMDRLFVDGEIGATRKLTVTEGGKPKHVILTLRDVL